MPPLLLEVIPFKSVFEFLAYGKINVVYIDGRTCKLEHSHMSIGCT